MRVFLLALCAVAVLGAAAAFSLQHFQKPVSEAFSTSGVRISSTE